jgi:hypothetical protein
MAEIKKALSPAPFLQDFFTQDSGVANQDGQFDLIEILQQRNKELPSCRSAL